MELSDFPMKKQIVFGQIWKRLVIIVVDLNYYELILICMDFIKRRVIIKEKSISWKNNLLVALKIWPFCKTDSCANFFFLKKQNKIFLPII